MTPPRDGRRGEGLGPALEAVAPVAGWRAVRVVDRLPARAGGGWTTLADALAPGAVERWVAVAGAGLAATAGGGRPVPRQVAPTYVLGWVLDALAQAGGTPYGLLRRVPALALDRVGVRRAPPLGQPDAVVLVGGAAWCLPDDGAAVRAGDRPVADGEELAAVLGRALVDAARAVEAAWAPPVRVGSHQRWGLLADAVDAVLGSAGAARGDPGAGACDADRVLRLSPAPLRRPGGVRVGGPAGWTRERRSCCFAYAASPALLCRTCPRLRRR